MEKEFVPYELAVKLKELGFDKLCLCHYHYGNILRSKIVSYVDGDCLKFDKFDKSIPAPLWQQAEDFLLKKYNLYGVIIPTVTMHWTFKTMTVVEGIVEVPPYNHVDANDYSTIEEARQACLEKLIELCQQN